MVDGHSRRTSKENLHTNPKTLSSGEASKGEANTLQSPQKQSDTSRLATRRGPLTLPPTGHENEVARTKKRSLPETRFSNASSPSAGSLKKQKISTAKVLPVTLTNITSAPVDRQIPTTEDVESSERQHTDQTIENLQPDISLPNAEEPPREALGGDYGSVAVRQVQITASGAARDQRPNKTHEQRTVPVDTSSNVSTCGSSRNEAAAGNTSPKTRLAAPVARMNTGTVLSVVSNFEPIKKHPHGEVRLGLMDKGIYREIPRADRKISKDTLLEIFNCFKQSHANLTFTGMDVTLRDACDIDGLTVGSVRLHAGTPWGAQLRDFFAQPALSERSQAGLDFVVEPVVLDCFWMD